MTVTGAGRAAYVPGGTRNGAETRRSEGITDPGTASFASVPAAVTCLECGSGIAPDELMVIYAEYNRTEYYCWPCARAHRHNWLIVPWLRHGARAAGRYSSEYSHRCRRCDRPFIGALARRYCSDQCGELTRTGRRNRAANRDARPCETCGQDFTPPRSDGRYCSGACRQKAYRGRTKESA